MSIKDNKTETVLDAIATHIVRRPHHPSVQTFIMPDRYRSLDSLTLIMNNETQFTLHGQQISSQSIIDHSDPPGTYQSWLESHVESLNSTLAIRKNEDPFHVKNITVIPGSVIYMHVTDGEPVVTYNEKYQAVVVKSPPNFHVMMGLKPWPQHVHELSKLLDESTRTNVDPQGSSNSPKQ